MNEAANPYSGGMLSLAIAGSDFDYPYHARGTYPEESIACTKCEVLQARRAFRPLQLSDAHGEHWILHCPRCGHVEHRPAEPGWGFPPIRKAKGDGPDDLDPHRRIIRDPSA